MSYHVSAELTVLLVVVLSFSLVSCCYLLSYCVWYLRAGRRALGSLDFPTGIDPRETDNGSTEEKPPRYEDLENQAPPPPSYQDWKTVYWIPGVASSNAAKDRMWGRANTVCEIHV